MAFIPPANAIVEESEEEASTKAVAVSFTPPADAVVEERSTFTPPADAVVE